jgi:membrane protein DedA with SNARE-associated domain
MALAVSVVAGIVGALVDYYLAFVLGRTFVERFLRKLGVGEASLQSAEKWFEGKGAWTILVGRFVPLVRSVISFPAGLFRMGMVTFVVMTLVGCLGWSAVLIYAGDLAGGLWNQVILSSSALLATGIVAFVAAASLLYIGYFVYEVGRNSRLSM